MNTDDVVAHAITEIDWSKPDSVADNGSKIYSMRCRLPFSTLGGHQSMVRDMLSDSNAVDLADVATELGIEIRGFEDVGHNGDGGGARVVEDDGDGIILPDDATGETGSNDEVLISGISSSTSVDFYGTEMSLRALKIMAVQMMAVNGVPYIPRHFGADGSMEWDDVIGRTIHAEVVPTERVAKPFNESETQFMLRTTIKLYGDEEKAQSLLRRVKRGEPIGQSIGGWFTHLQVVQTEDGEVERVIVQGVELDHLAVTRAPANPDSIGIVSLRSALQNSATEYQASKEASDMTDETIAEPKAAEARDADSEISAEADTVSLDNNVGTAHDTSINARRSATTDPVSTPSATADTPSEEYAMNKEDLQSLQDVVRSAISDATAPLIERVQALEVAERSEPTPEPAPEPAPAEPTVDALVLEARKVADAAVARATAAEAALVAANKRPMRQGRSVTPSIAGHAGVGAANSLIERSRTGSPNLAAVATRCVEAITDAPVPGTKVTRSQLDAALCGILVAAESDGIITDPSHRAVWQ